MKAIVYALQALPIGGRCTLTNLPRPFASQCALLDKVNEISVNTVDTEVRTDSAATELSVLGSYGIFRKTARFTADGSRLAKDEARRGLQIKH
jgi:hypothetical protein